jgi:excisionase family DNA binding protein
MAIQLSLEEIGSMPADPPDLRGVPEPAVCRLLTAQEVAQILRVPPSTVYELARSRRIPFVKVGRRTRFEAQSLQGWIAAQTVQPR